MKKKALSTVLALALCGMMSMTAFAADTKVDEKVQDKTGNTNVEFTVDPTYTVTIPATVTLGKQGNQYIGTGDITADAGLRLKENEEIEVRLTDCDYQLDTAASATYKLPYTVKAGETAVTANSNLVATFRTVANADVQESELTFTADDPTYAGVYKDTVTFTVAVVNK